MKIKINNQPTKVAVLPNNPPLQHEMDVLTKKVEILTRKENMNAVKISEVNMETSKSIVAELVKKSNRILASISTHRFPFDFFPNTINIEEGRVTVIIRSFFLSSQVHSVDIKDISNIFINMAPFFAQLVIYSKTFEANEVRIRYLWKKQAIYARRIIEGLRIFQEKQIDTSMYSKKELISKLEDLSTTEIVT
ncbi:hypothetical protein A2334_04660 [Candidatus Roizmanbacteria bacterium RIFOXYB2_FULL_38_10]|uniref:Uncharacterized protein n=1 Tax=Candidatus Roizmanbacteria bacterium RIFOXYD1_FULL_38_12 TaxID=1802093 RepID=A0A1F7KZJ7_9BACT|nr:MAG: hypothetical protein A3K47_00760 [Candidatus Roizmanbacteria bacterium RIFOXYA2_FULL_38_14]OGK63319.1 MAG: hypothetical protein A3K27_00760 [Candidatus Roizmanbacteria bacterium RIFOXYA1_FULL_37_12]OGK65165.1 MAG: hypothetical protein A3K38_00760 [Candidatus Roizmanbacteria bacterium RIFOXYB1_FULL_40_23]OGK68721.1 MAG: hypothetical protein A2334_04660 [Candidatus Roizmanbacteria bacterium RIFOXYB2_FULL_38_10]OGK69570.1 MAG: hypothetical protein A3K21_00765 [Candidatus Roizmanbacteria ba